jgi:N4-gp56 family major capsid protein
MTQIYNDPAGGSDSSIGEQTRTDYYNKKALVEAAKESYFGQLASVIAMPKNMGKKIKQFHYLPVLDDRNQNEQGLDALGAAPSAGTLSIAYISVLPLNGAESQTFYFRGDSTTSDAAALLEAKANFNAWAVSQGYAGATITDVAADAAASYAELVTAISTDYAMTVIAATANTPYGNLYGSSKDIGTIQGKIPALGESGGEVNRIGHKRIEIEGTIEKFGIHDKYTKESLDFDSDAELLGHITSESVKAANEITEDQLQIDLINGAGVVRYAGAATSIATLNGEDASSPFAAGNTNSTVNYDDLVKLGIELDNNRTPKMTKVIMGSRMVDTKVVNAARYIYIGSELQSTIMRMTDYHDNKAFIPVAQYADAGNVARGEFGAIDNFRFIVVPEMMHKQGAGADVSDALEETSSFRYGSAADGASLSYNAYPMLVVGDGSFTTIGFQTDGKTVKFKIKHVKPESDVSYALDKFGETGFYSIKWYYGTMILRPERLAVLWSVAEW